MTRYNDAHPDLSEQAAEWLIKLDSDALSAEAQAEFELWYGKSAAHRQAYAQAEQVWRDLDSAVMLNHAPAPQTIPPGYLSYKKGVHPPGVIPPQRRMMLAGITALCILFLAVFSGDLWIGFSADYQTRPGEQRTITLADGSTLHLDTDSAVAVDLSATVRELKLLKGEALFEVAPDAARPFRVHASGGASTALGTEFMVRNTAEEVTVTVLESHVAVAYPAASAAAQISTATLAPGQQLVYSAALGLGQPRQVDLRSATAWRRGKIIFEQQSLGKVIDELNRYQVGHIQITDPELRNLRVNGVFSTRDPLLVITALERSLSLHSTRLTRYLILLHR